MVEPPAREAFGEAHCSVQHATSDHVKGLFLECEKWVSGGRPARERQISIAETHSREMPEAPADAKA
jgi:hypothetical protein